MHKVVTALFLCLLVHGVSASYLESHGTCAVGVVALGIAGQLLEAIGIQLMKALRTQTSLMGRLLSVLWGQFILAIGCLMVLMSLGGEYSDIDKAILGPIFSLTVILVSLGSTLKTIGRWDFIKRANLKDNWQCDWLKRCVRLTNPTLSSDSSEDFDHFSALVHICDNMLQVCKPGNDRAWQKTVILLPFFCFFSIVRKAVTFIENTVLCLGGSAFRRDGHWKIDSVKLPLMTDHQIDMFELELKKWEDRDKESEEPNVGSNEPRELFRLSWAEFINALHVGNLLTTTRYSALLRRSMIMETHALVFGRIKCVSLRRVGGSWYPRETGLLTGLGRKIEDTQGEEPGLQLVWNVIICNDELEAPHLWAELVLSSVEAASAERLKTTLKGVFDDREFNHVATNHEKWFVDVAMYCWWNMTRCETTEQMVDELATARFMNMASVIVSAAEKILQEDTEVFKPLSKSIGEEAHIWLSGRAWKDVCKNDLRMKTLSPDKEHYGMRNFVDALEFAQVGVSDLRKEAYAVVAAGLWTTATGVKLTKEHYDQIAQVSSQPGKVLDRVREFSKCYWRSKRFDYFSQNEALAAEALEIV